MPGDLDGIRVLVTRPADPESDFAASLERRGATVASLPLIAIGPPPDERALRAAVASAEQFDWVAFASVAGVESFVHRRERPLPVDRPRLAAVGPATAKAIEAALGRPADLVPTQYSGEALADALREGAQEEDRILIVQAQDARPALAARLRASGREVTAIAAYSTVEVRPHDLDRELKASDVVVVTSPSAVRALVRALGDAHPAAMLRGKLIACIGPVTLFEARELGLHVEVVPESSTLEALVEALCTYYSTRPSTR